jgi:gliding motility-associated-like protein
VGDLYVPNAFAPGGMADGANKFGILNYNIAKLNYFRIFNRWGELVFETNNPAAKWDGIYNGKPAAQGVYVWEADGYCTSGVRINKRGNVTLLR